MRPLALALALALAVSACHPAASPRARPPEPARAADAKPDGQSEGSAGEPRAAQAQPRGEDAGVVDASADAGADAAPAATVPCARDEDCFHSGHGHRARCFTQSLAEQYTQAFHDCADGAAWRAAHEVGTCVFDECRGDDGPDGDTCGPDARCGILDMVPFPQRVCVPARCHRAADCTAHRGGTCASYLAAGRCERGGWACSYPGDECIPRHPVRRCPVVRGVINYCAPVDGRFRCVAQPAVVSAPAGR